MGSFAVLGPERALAAVGVSGGAAGAGLRVPDAPGEAGKGMGTGGPDPGESRAFSVGRRRHDLHCAGVGLGGSVVSLKVKSAS